MDKLNGDKVCPLCGEYNQCKSGEETCWCFHVKVPKELIERIPEEKRGKSCICERCIDKYNKGQKERI